MKLPDLPSKHTLIQTRIQLNLGESIISKMSIVGVELIFHSNIDTLLFLRKIVTIKTKQYKYDDKQL